MQPSYFAERSTRPLTPALPQSQVPVTVPVTPAPHVAALPAKPNPGSTFAGARPKAQPKNAGAATPATPVLRPSLGAPEPEPGVPKSQAGQLGTEPPAERGKLQWDRRWASWEADGVQVGACIWADLKVEGDLWRISRLKKEIEAKLALALGAESIVAIVDDEYESHQRLFVCLLAKAEECVELRSTWKRMSFLDGAAFVSWRDTIDTASQNHVPHLRECWNPKKHKVDAFSLALPRHWAFLGGRLPSHEPPAHCAPGSHWHNFAQIWGEVAEARFMWKGDRPETIYLVASYATKAGPKAAYRDLTGRCLKNPMSSKQKAGSP